MLVVVMVVAITVLVGGTGGHITVVIVVSLWHLP